MLTNLTICIVLLLVQAQTSPAKTPEYWPANFAELLRVDAAKRCMWGQVSLVASDIPFALDYLDEDCEDREDLKKHEDYQTLLDWLDDFYDIIYERGERFEKVLDRCNITHCPADIQEQTKKLQDDMYKIVSKGYDGAAQILEKMKPSTICAFGMKCLKKISYCLYIYKIEDCMVNIEPVFHSIGDKIFKLDNLGTKKHRRERIGALKGPRNAFSKNKSDSYVTASANGRNSKKLRKLYSNYGRKDFDISLNPNVQGCDKMPSFNPLICYITEESLSTTFKDIEF